MPSDIELRRLNRIAEHIDKKLGDITKGILAVNINLAVLVKLMEDKEKSEDAT